MAQSMIIQKDKPMHVVLYTGTTDSAGVLLIPQSTFDPRTMHLVNIIGTDAKYAAGITTTNNVIYVRIVRYDGQAIASASASVYVYYIDA